MIKQILLTISLSLALSAPLASYALTSHNPANPQINIYANPKATAQVIAKISPAQRLVPIFQQSDWLKVGDPRDGKVGWINKHQYQQAIQAFNQPDIQTVFIRRERNANGKPTINVVAYKNGNKLSQKDANELYQKLRKQQQTAWRAMQHMNQNMEAMFAAEMRDMHNMFNSMLNWDTMLDSTPKPTAKRH